MALMIGSSIAGITTQSWADGPLGNIADSADRKEARCSGEFFSLNHVDANSETLLSLCCTSEPLVSQFETGGGTLISTGKICAFKKSFLRFYSGSIWQNGVAPIPAPATTPPVEASPTPTPSEVVVPAPTESSTPLPEITYTPEPENTPTAAPTQAPAPPVTPPIKPIPQPNPQPETRPTIRKMPANTKFFSNFNPGGSCWNNNRDVIATGPFVRLATHPGYDQMRTCMTINSLGGANASRVEPHAYGGFSVQAGHASLLIDMGLEGQSGQAWMNNSGKDSSGMIPFLRMRVPDHSMMTLEKSHWNSSFQMDQIKPNAKFALIQGANDEASPFRFHVGDHVCMTLSMNESPVEKDLTEFQVKIDPYTTLKRHQDADGAYRMHTLKEILVERYQDLVDNAQATEPLTDFIQDSVKFGLALRTPGNKINSASSKARIVMSVATNFTFTGGDLDDTKMDVIWENVQAHRVNWGWSSLLNAGTFEQDLACSETTRSPSRMIRSFSNGSDLILSIRAGHQSMNLTDAQTSYIGTRQVK